LRKQQKKFAKERQDLIVKQQVDMLELKKDYDNLKHLLLAKDDVIQKLQNIAIEQEVPISKQRLFKFISNAKLEEDKQENEEAKELGKDIKALKVQIIGMKELVKMYQEQTEKARKDLKECEASLKWTQEKAEEDKKNMIEENEKNTKKLLEDNAKIFEKYKKFKEEVRKELERTHMVIKQQADVNSSLKKELHSAKLVLVTPRLRDKFTSRIKGQEFALESIPNESRLTVMKKNMKKKNSTMSYLISTRASPAENLSPDINLNSSLPLVGLLPEISTRYLNS